MKPNRFTFDKPTEPGWYWCRNMEHEEPGKYWLGICCVTFGDDGKIVASWMTEPGKVQLMHEKDFNPVLEWAGPLNPPLL